MSRHPVTPMEEADVRLHLVKQTGRSIGLVDLIAMKHGEADASLDRERALGAEIVASTWSTTRRSGRPAAWFGSTGGALPSPSARRVSSTRLSPTGVPPGFEQPKAAFRAPPAERIACVSGSCSPVTAGQIAFAEQNGFATIRLDAARAVDEAAWERELGRAADRALAAIGGGKDLLVFTAAGRMIRPWSAWQRRSRPAG